MTQRLVDILRESPLFNVSLASKELFHSNFLAWLFTTYPRESGALLSKFLMETHEPPYVTEVLREFRNRDLTIRFSDGQELVIENKVKSLPYLEQLREYSADAELHQRFLLLSLLPPPFSSKGGVKIDGATWRILTYGELARMLEELRGKIADTYHAAMISDYIAFIAAFSELFSSRVTDGNTRWNDAMRAPHGMTLGDLRELRIGDIYQKLQYEWFAETLRAELDSRFPGIVRISGRGEVCPASSIRIGHGMTRGTGLVEASYVLVPGLYVTVQVQDNAYKQMLQGYPGYGARSRDVANRLFEKQLWFGFSGLGDGLQEYPRGSKRFNGYGETDFYRSVKIPASMTVSDVRKAFCDDIERIIKNCDAFKSEA